MFRCMYGEIEHVRERLEALLRMIQTYLSRRGFMVSTREILDLLLAIKKDDLSAELAVEDSPLGTKLFRSLRRYLPAHIRNIIMELRSLAIGSRMPSVISKVLFSIYSDGSKTLPPPVCVLGLTEPYIRKSLRTLLLYKRSTMVSSRAGFPGVDIKVIVKFNELVEKIKKKLEPAVSEIEEVKVDFFDFIDCFVGIGEAIRREVMEELHVKIKSMNPIAVNTHVDYFKGRKNFVAKFWCLFWYLVEIEGIPRAGSDLTEIRWMEREKVLENLGKNFLRLLPQTLWMYFSLKGEKG